MNRFTIAGILQTLSCVFPLLLLSAIVLRGGFEPDRVSALSAVFLIIPLVIGVSAALCFLSKRKPSLRTPALACCLLLCIPCTLLTLITLALIVKELVAPSTGFFGPDFAITIYLGLLCYIAPIALCSGISAVLSKRGMREEKGQHVRRA